MTGFISIMICNDYERLQRFSFNLSNLHNLQIVFQKYIRVKYLSKSVLYEIFW